MRTSTSKALFCVLTALALSVGAGGAAADVTYGLGTANTAALGPGPYGSVTVSLTDSTHATVTFTANTSGGYAMVDGGSAGLNVSGAFTVSAIGFTCSSLSSCTTGASHNPAPAGTIYLANSGANQLDGWGHFNLVVDQADGWGSATHTLSFTLTNTSGTWASAGAVLTANDSGQLVASHVGYCPASLQVNGKCASIEQFNPDGTHKNDGTGFAVVPIPAAAWLFGSGLIGLIGIARRKLTA